MRLSIGPTGYLIHFLYVLFLKFSLRAERQLQDSHFGLLYEINPPTHADSGGRGRRYADAGDCRGVVCGDAPVFKGLRDVVCRPQCSLSEYDIYEHIGHLLNTLQVAHGTSHALVHKL